jgi:hypothetical protein
MRLMPEGDKAPRQLDSSKSIMIALAHGQPITFGLALAAATLCYRIRATDAPDVLRLTSKREVERAAHAIRHALKVSNEELDEMTGVFRALAVLLADSEPAVAAMKRFLAQPAAASTRTLLDALDSIGLHAQRIAWLRGRLDGLWKTDYAAVPLITGDDLTAAGFQPGPMFKRVLNDVYDAQLEDRIRTRGEAMALARALFDQA